MKSKDERKYTLDKVPNFNEVMQNIKAARKTDKNHRNKKRRRERKREWKARNEN